MNKFDFMQEELDRLRENHLDRHLTWFTSPQSSHVRIGDRDLLMLSSNNYLDLCHHPAVIRAAAVAAERYGTGSGGSRLTTGTGLSHGKLEELLARFKGEEAALVFNTGYMANIGIISAVCDRDWVIFSDELNHASIIDGCRLSRARTVIYAHNDMTDLERRLQDMRPEKALIVSDGVFSMDGDICRLPELVELGERYGCLTMIDEAHATGVIGGTGRGTAEHYGMQRGADITVGTLSKSIGSEGGFVVGSRTLITYLKNRARSFIFSTAMSPVTAAASVRALELMMEGSERTLQLQENVRTFCRALQENGIEVFSQTAIIPIVIGEEEMTMSVAEMLRQKGFYISGIRYPTVKRGEARLRVTLMSTHTREELKEAAGAVAECIRTVEERNNRIGEMK